MENNSKWTLVIRQTWMFVFFVLGIGVYPSIGFGETIYADVVALDQVITYNRFGSFNPNGMIYALRRDVVEDTLDTDGKEKPIGDDGGKPGGVMLRKNKRPRPLVLRVNEGDTLVIRFTNLLSPLRRGARRDVPEERCGMGGKIEKLFNFESQKIEGEHENDAPATRCASIVVSGLTPIRTVGKTGEDREPVDMKHTGISGISPGSEIIYRWFAEREGTYLFFSNAAPAGGEGDGGSLVHGLFGAVHVEPRESLWYRSQLTEEMFTEVLDNKEAFLSATKENPIYPKINYNAVKNDDPVLSILKPIRGNNNEDLVPKRTIKVNEEEAVINYEIIYGDLNTIIECGGDNLECSEKKAQALSGTPAAENVRAFNGVVPGSFREFTVIFHDELKTVHPFDLLNNEPQLAGIRDGFGINYGASGLGTILLANRNGIGPGKDCIECFYEEFFLQSWVNGDPALLVEYPVENPVDQCAPFTKQVPKLTEGNPFFEFNGEICDEGKVVSNNPIVPFKDDPSNVHHSYLGDNVKFRNLHAGPKETHVFHLHAHQWLSEGDKGHYLDSQTIGPEQGFAYNIFYEGSGNRNLSPGDSIFHCHLYPHFAQGMWELWRVHDVFEDGSRLLPDGEITIGTPIPALVPMPRKAMAPMPTDDLPGFPFYIAGEVGHRAPQPPYDMENDGGLPRHVIFGNEGTRETHEDLVSGDFSAELHIAKIKLLPSKGTLLERNAMAFHELTFPGLTPKNDGVKKIGYQTKFPDLRTEGAIFKVNGLKRVKGAPFADPCPPGIQRVVGEGNSFFEKSAGGEIVFDKSLLPGLQDSTEASWWAGLENTSLKDVRYAVSAIQIDMEVNAHGWHDPQARINVLDAHLNDYEWEEGDRKKGRPNPNAEPFFFRAHSGDCITFYHTNRTPHVLDVDDFQVKTPTDIIGQHIHLVKFDVTSSDGSANGWNYEDGTFARCAIIERIKAANAEGGGFFKEEGREIVKLSARPLPGKNDYQTTIQRWWADPLTGSETNPNNEADTGEMKKDHTIRTVFTHDHFAPSSIQQHGFYGALVIEPRGSEWFKPDGTPLVVDPKNPKAVGTRAIIQMPVPGNLENETDPKKKFKGDYREFMLAIADFALLYDPNTPPKQGTIRPEWGNPVDPPSRGPEAISTDHHNPYLLNYKHDPIPLRIGRFNDDGSLNRSHPLKDGNAGDMAHVFDSTVHGDPFLRPFNAFEGDDLQIRVIQGAQEVQHTMTVNGLRWQRNINGENPLYVNAQEIGISEHFEMKMPSQNNDRGSETTDYLIHFGSVDDLWNGAWGLIRSFEGKQFGSGEVFAIDPDTKLKIETKPLRSNPKGKFENSDSPCPISDITFTVEAWAAKDLSYKEVIAYNTRENIYDEEGLRFILTGVQFDKTTSGPTPVVTIDGQPEEPLVLRATKGSCIQVILRNELGNTPLPKGVGNAELPKITSLRADDFPPSNKVSLHAQLLTYNVMTGDGTFIGYNVPRGESLNPVVSPAPPGNTANYTWYAGTYEPDENGKLVKKPVEFGAINLTSFGDVIKHGTMGLVGALIIEPEGALICPNVKILRGSECPVLELDANEEESNLTADIYSLDENGKRDELLFREFVVIYQDGLNLHKAGEPILDCHICDDSYDLGEKAINYRTEPFWARLGMPFETCINEETGSPANCDDTNHMVYPQDFFQENYKDEKGIEKGVETTIFRAKKGQNIRFRVLQPAGRARQRSFQVYGHDYNDYGIPNFGSAHSSLISVGKGITAELCGGAKEGTWIYRDGPNFMFSGGAWGLFKVSSEKAEHPADKDNCTKK